MRVGNNLCVCVCSVVSNSLQPHGPPGLSVHGIFQARMLEWVAIVAGNAHFVNSWIPKDRHPLATAEGCGTGKGTGTAWSREPCIPPCVGTVSELPNLAVAGRPRDRKSTRLNSSHSGQSRMPSSA